MRIGTLFELYAKLASSTYPLPSECDVYALSCRSGSRKERNHEAQSKSEITHIQQNTRHSSSTISSSILPLLIPSYSHPITSYIPAHSSSFHNLSGNLLPTSKLPHAKQIKITYTAVPPNHSCCTDAANKDVDMAGPTARTIEAASCASPLVAPREWRLGEAADTYRNIEPKRCVLLVLAEISRSRRK